MLTIRRKSGSRWDRNLTLQMMRFISDLKNAIYTWSCWRGTLQSHSLLTSFFLDNPLICITCLKWLRWNLSGHFYHLGAKNRKRSLQLNQGRCFSSRQPNKPHLLELDPSAAAKSIRRKGGIERESPLKCGHQAVFLFFFFKVCVSHSFSLTRCLVNQIGTILVTNRMEVATEERK